MLISPYLFWMLLFLPSGWNQISETNQAIENAVNSFKETDFENSVRDHLSLINDYELNTPEVRFNLALSYQNNGQEEEAKKTYELLIGVDHPYISSYAANQQGVLIGKEQEYKDALSYFKTALLKNPDNEEARYNYELLSRWLEQNESEQEEEEKQEEEDKMEPSNYAKRMKAQADEMVDRFQFGEAMDIMNRALEIDETVAYYQDYMNSLGEINEINELQ